MAAIDAEAAQCAKRSRDLVVQTEWFEDLLRRIEVDDWRLLTEFIWHMGRVSEAETTWERVNHSRRVQFVKTKSPTQGSCPDEVERICCNHAKQKTSSHSRASIGRFVTTIGRRSMKRVITSDLALMCKRNGTSTPCVTPS